MTRTTVQQKISRFQTIQEKFPMNNSQVIIKVNRIISIKQKGNPTTLLCDHKKIHFYIENKLGLASPLYSTAGLSSLKQINTSISCFIDSSHQQILQPNKNLSSSFSKAISIVTLTDWGYFLTPIKAKLKPHWMPTSFTSTSRR